jgi:transposase-like protein
VLDKLPKAMQPKVKAELHDIWMAQTRKAANVAFDLALARYQAKYPKRSHRIDLCHGAPAHQTQSQLWLPRHHLGEMVFKLLQSAEKRWRKIRGFKKLGTGHPQRPVPGWRASHRPIRSARRLTAIHQI